MNLISEQIQEPIVTANSELLSIDINQYPEINHMIGNNYPMIDIDLPFPPVIEPKDLIVNKKSPQDNPNGKQSRAPNAFIIYRKAFVKAARDQGYILPMTVISTMASASWEKESSLVKEEYKKIAKDTHKLIKEMFPKKSNQRKRKEKWNLVSFQNKSLNDGNKKEIDNIVVSTQELTAINDNDNNNSMINTPLTSVSSILTTAASSPNLSEFDGNISEKSLAFQQQSILSEVKISNDYLIDELNNTYLPNSFQEYLNSYLPGEDNQSGSDFLLKNWLNQSQDLSEFTWEELFDTTTSMDDLKECNNSPTSLNMTLAEAMGIINSEKFEEDLENFQF